ncbi:U6 snRNA-associated Sm-like protein LSm8 [Nakaseomyces bracarensis]|uniref:U6 snRNA-associated Sm-like protein LSm8 n=1 Tax=Nakaseomyces bracarensis TaxID=273131 RepID=A0ABR4NR60_9SACH
MSPLLKEYLNQRVVLVTTEGEVLEVLLEGYDKYTNLVVIDGGKVRLLRGSEVVLCGLLNEDIDTSNVRYKDTKNKVEDEHLVWARVWEQRQSRHKKRKLK